MHSTTTSIIPSIIHQTWITYDDVHGIEKNWLDISPQMSYNFADDVQIEKYIKEHHDAHVFNCYTRLLCGAAKSDFYRYCVLYNEGGVYIDIDIKPISPVEQIINNTPLVVVNDQYGLYNAFIAVKPGHELLKLCIDQVCENIEQNKHNGGDGMAITRLCGPKMFADVFKQYFNTDNLESRQEPEYTILYHDIPNQGISFDDRPLLKTQCMYECQQKQFDTGGH